MTNTPVFPANISLWQLLDSVQTGLLLCAEECRLVFANRVARDLFTRAGLDADHEPCYRLLFGHDGCCPDCPIDESALEGKRHGLTLKGPDGADIYLKVFCRTWQGRHLLTIHDLTQEITLLRRSDMDRKELQAKNILLERRRRLNLIEQDFLSQLMNNLPDALITVDDAFVVQRKNAAADEMFPNNPAHCFSLLGYEDPCLGCPARQGFGATDGRKKSHEVGDRIFTEIFSSGPNGRGGLLIFRDNTRQVGLIGQIREQREEIARKNKLLSVLVEFGTYLQKENDGGEVADHFLDTILPNLHCGAVALVIQDSRPGNLWLTRQRGMSDEELDLIGKACLSREFLQNKTGGLAPQEILPWLAGTQIPLAGAKGQRIGLILIEGAPGGEELDVLRLVTEPLGAYFQNQLLLNQLEEKANNDGLTGLFNRGYLSQALNEEHEKFIHYRIHYAVIVVDVNQLKKLNDEYGHEAGDRLIITVAQALKKTLRNTDIAARTGGDEFVLLMSACTEADAGHFIDRLQQQVFAGMDLPLADGTTFPVSVSLGYAGSDMFVADGLVSPEVLLGEADQRMYRAKEEFYQSMERYR